MTEEPKTGMSKFWGVFEHYKRLLLAAGAASFLPFVAEFADASGNIERLVVTVAAGLPLTRGA